MEGWICFITIVLVVIGVVWFFRSRSRRHYYLPPLPVVTLEQVGESYRAALGELRSDPTNGELRQQALEQGQAYVAIIREQQADLNFDAIALAYDLVAATASVSLAPSAKLSIADRLRQIEDLRQQGLVSEAEYRERRRAILSEV